MSLLETETRAPAVPLLKDDAETAISSSAEMMQALIGGQLRREMGLEPADLRLGLTVAKNLLSRGLETEAMRVYAVLVLCDPTDVDFQVGLANCASATEEHYVALQAASAAVALAPSDPRGYLLSGRSCMHIGSLAEAEQDLTDALDLAERSGQAAVVREATLLLERLSRARAEAARG